MFARLYFTWTHWTPIAGQVRKIGYLKFCQSYVSSGLLRRQVFRSFLKTGGVRKITGRPTIAHRTVLQSVLDLIAFWNEFVHKTTCIYAILCDLYAGSIPSL